MLYVVCAKTKIQHEGETVREYPSFYYFSRSVVNIYIERFWRSLKQEKIYLNPPNGGLDLYQKVREYINFYNQERRHTEIGKIPPDQCYYKKSIAS